MNPVSLATTIAIGGACAVLIGNTVHAAIERYLTSCRQARSAREAGQRIAARIASGDADA